MAPPTYHEPVPQEDAAPSYVTGGGVHMEGRGKCQGGGASRGRRATTAGWMNPLLSDVSSSVCYFV